MSHDEGAQKKSIFSGILSAAALVGAAALAIAEAPLLAGGALLVGVGALGYAVAKGKEAAREAEEAAKERCPHCGCRFESSEIVNTAVEMPLLAPSERPDLKPACRSCFHTTNDAHLKAYEQADKSADRVRLFAIGYKGSPPIDGQKAGKEVSTESFRNRDDADRSLKVTAAFLGYGVVYERDFSQSTGTDGNFRYSMWSAYAKLG